MLYPFSPDTIAVFPTEVSARFWRDWSARYGPRRAVRTDRFISWDTFADRMTGLPEDVRRADGMTRFASAHMILEGIKKNTVPLSRLIPPEHHQSPGRFHRLIAAMLPSLRQLSMCASPLKDDFKMLYGQYREILEAAGCREISFSQYDIRQEALDEAMRYVIFFPELITGYDHIMEHLKYSNTEFVPAGKFASLQEEGGSSLLLYENSTVELHALADWVEKLLGSGVHPSEICITLGDYDGWEEPLKEECSLRGIPLSFRRGISLGSHPAGRVFQDLLAAVTGRWSLEQVKQLLLNRGYPWKHRKELEQTALLGIEHRCISSPPGTDLWTRLLKKEGTPQLLSLWRRFSSHASAMISEKEPEKLRESLFGFLDIWMDRESRGEDEFSLVFDYCLQLGTDFLDVCSRLGTSSSEGLYQLWVRLLKDSRYIPQSTDEGVQVYPYGLSAGIRPKHHGAAGISQESTQMLTGDLPFFSEAALLQAGLGVRDLSSSFMMLLGGEELRISCARETFSGYALPPAHAEHQVLEHPGGQNPFQQETKWWALDPSSRRWMGEHYPVQQEGFTYAAASVFSAPKLDLADRSIDGPVYRDLLEKTLMRRDPGFMRITPYSLDEFTRCPFDWVFSHLLRIEECRTSPGFSDPRDEGTLLHHCLDAFFRSAVDIGGTFDAGKIEKYRQLMQQCIIQVLQRAQDEHIWMLDGIREEYEASFSDMLMQYLEQEVKHLDRWTCSGLEVRLEYRDEQQGYIASGRADRISAEPEGRGFAVIDYKRGSPPKGSYLTDKTPPSWQLPFYGWLAEELGIAEGEPRYALYYSLTGGKFYPVLDGEGSFRSRSAVKDPEAFLQLQQRSRRAAEEMADAVKQGDFTRKAADCTNCRDRLLCRRRYHVR